jgi:hypothetical protein
MTDIVERLDKRNFPYGSYPVMDEAKIEIRRLRAERAGDQQRLFHYETEIERLRAALLEKDKVYVREMAKVATRDAGIERLIADNDKMRDWIAKTIDFLGRALEQARKG